MSKMSKAVSEITERNNLRADKIVTNFMRGESYSLNPIDILRMVSASSIFGEPQYYRESGFRDRIVHKRMEDNIMLSFEDKTATEVMTEVIDNALDFDFAQTLQWAVDLRKKYNMRLNPQVIMVRAAIHPKRSEYTNTNPGEFSRINSLVMSRADESMSQMSYFIYDHKSKSNMPSILKRSWAKHLSSLNRYQVAKYKNHELGMINAVRLCHANSSVINELMTNGTIVASEDEMTWENYISKHGSNRESWNYVINNIFTHPCKSVNDKPTAFEYGGRAYYATNHMAILRNLRNMSENVDIETMKFVLEALKAGVLTGKQFPFRYYSAIRALEENCYCSPLVIDALEECLDISVENMPKLRGRTMCLSDNSGSAWGQFTSEYGTVTVAEIDNLSAVITAARSDEGYVGKFGDKLKIFPISKRRGLLQQARDITKGKHSDVGGSTEGGIWKFFRGAIENAEHWDNIFIYSDQQAGIGKLYGTPSDKSEYAPRGYSYNDRYINVYKLVLDYRKMIYQKVNVFSVQTGGYDNNLLPEYSYRINCLYGWTGKESIFAREMIDFWDSIENKHKKQ